MEQEKLYTLKLTRNEMFTLEFCILQELSDLRKTKSDSLSSLDESDILTLEKRINDVEKVLNFIIYSMRSKNNYVFHKHIR